MKVALVYDRINKWGGAERLLLAFHKLYPSAPIFTSVYNPEKAKWAGIFKVKTSFLQEFPHASSTHELYATLMPIAFENFDFDSYDLVISVTSEAAKGIITKPGTLHICFCLTPTRYLWSSFKTYFKNPYLRFFSKPAVSYLKTWDKVASTRPDYFIAISNEVKKRIKKYYGRESTVIYPPLTLLPSSNKEKKGDYFLIVSRLVPYKMVDTAILACNKLKLPLKIVGMGSHYNFLKSISGKTIEFLGQLSDSKLSYYYKNCRAFIFPGAEDLGLTMIEAQAHGSPVIAFKEAGALEIIRQGKTGEFFTNLDSLSTILVNFDDSRYNRALCIENSERFSFEVFKKNFEEFLSNL